MLWSWNGKERRAFEVLKAAVTSALVLVSPQDLELFCIEADSLDFTTGAVLSQQLPGDKKQYSVMFYSNFLSLVEQNYKIYDKEILTIIHVLEKQRHFLEGAKYPVEIWTDHKNLEYFMIAKKLNCHQACWSLYLAYFDFTLVHCLGHSMKKLDTLSWRPNHGIETSNNKDITLFYPEIFTVQALEGVKLEGVERNMLSNICKDNCSRDQEKPIAQATCKLQQFSSQMVHSTEWSNIDSLLYFQDKIYIFWNPELRRYIILLCHNTGIAGHPSW